MYYVNTHTQIHQIAEIWRENDFDDHHYIVVNKSI